jgi:hypothetical protein
LFFFAQRACKSFRQTLFFFGVVLLFASDTHVHTHRVKRMLTKYWPSVETANKRQQAQEQHQRNEAKLADEQQQLHLVKEGEQAARIHFA